MANDNEDPMDIEKTVVQTVSERKGYTLAVGQSLGQYRIVRPLGRGGMGEVYEAEHTTLGRRYALKLLPADFDRSPEALDRFRREARVMANLEHPNIIRVDDFGEADGRYWLRMELAEGLSHQRSETGGQRPTGVRMAGSSRWPIWQRRTGGGFRKRRCCRFSGRCCRHSIMRTGAGRYTGI